MDSRWFNLTRLPHLSTLSKHEFVYPVVRVQGRLVTRSEKRDASDTLIGFKNTGLAEHTHRIKSCEFQTHSCHVDKSLRHPGMDCC